MQSPDHSPFSRAAGTALLVVLFVAAGTYCALFPVYDPPDSALGSLEEAVAAVASLNRSGCTIPGTMMDSSGGACPHQLRKYLRRCGYGDDGLVADSSSSTDSIAERQLRIAHYAFCRLSPRAMPAAGAYRPSHARFIGYLDEPANVQVSSWQLRLLQWMADLLERGLDWLYQVFSSSLKALKPGWIALLVGAFVVISFFLVIIAARVTSRVYPAGWDRASSVPRDASGSAATGFLSAAGESLAEGDCRRCIVLLYHWILDESAKHRIVKREEWWTNGQFLSLFSGRSPGNTDLGRAIVAKYESIVYGHREPSHDELQTILSRARAAVLRRT